MIITFATNEAAKNESFSQKLPGNAPTSIPPFTPAALFYRPLHKTFRMTRQGVRWRFQRLFNHIYVEAFETILMIEKTFGIQLREHAVRISKERWSLRSEAQNSGFQSAGNIRRK